MGRPGLSMDVPAIVAVLIRGNCDVGVCEQRKRDREHWIELANLKINYTETLMALCEQVPPPQVGLNFPPYQPQDRGVMRGKIVILSQA